MFDTPTLPIDVARAMPIAEPPGRERAVEPFVTSLGTVGLPVPATLQAILDAMGTIRGQATGSSASSIGGALLDDLIAGHATADEITKSIEDAAVSEALAGARSNIRGDLLKLAVKRFHKALIDGAADEILDELRPRVTAAVAKFTAARAADVPLHLSPTEFMNTATPAQLVAWQDVRVACATLDQVAGFLRPLGPLGDLPVVGNYEEYSKYPVPHYAAFFLGAGALGATVEAFASPNKNAQDVRTSVWLRIPVKLSTVAEANEAMRAWAESAWAAGPKGTDARFKNPYVLPEGKGAGQ